MPGAAGRARGGFGAASVPLWWVFGKKRGKVRWYGREGWYLETVLGLNPGYVTWPSYITSLSLIYKMKTGRLAWQLAQCQAPSRCLLSPDCSADWIQLGQGGGCTDRDQGKGRPREARALTPNLTPNCYFVDLDQGAMCAAEQGEHRTLVPFTTR